MLFVRNTRVDRGNLELLKFDFRFLKFSKKLYLKIMIAIVLRHNSLLIAKMKNIKKTSMDQNK